MGRQRVPCADRKGPRRGCHCLYCKEHRRNYARQPHVKARMRRWRQAKADHISAYRKQYRHANAADVAAYQRWYQQHRRVKDRRWRCEGCTRIVVSRVACPGCKTLAPWRRPMRDAA